MDLSKYYVAPNLAGLSGPDDVEVIDFSDDEGTTIWGMVQKAPWWAWVSMGLGSFALYHSYKTEPRKPRSRRARRSL